MMSRITTSNRCAREVETLAAVDDLVPVEASQDQVQGARVQRAGARCWPTANPPTTSL